MVKNTATVANTHRFGAMKYSSLEFCEFLDYVEAKIVDSSSGYCCIPNVYESVLVNSDPTMRQANDEADMVYSDSRILTLVLSLLDREMPLAVERGDRIVAGILERLGAQARIALVGGKNDAQLVRLAEHISTAFASRTVHLYSPPYGERVSATDAKLCAKINSQNANLVLVGLGCPKQEIWMLNNSSLLSAYCIGVGAAFDYLVGEIRDSPRFVHAMGIEWLSRMASDPKRMAARNLDTLLPFLRIAWREFRSRS